MKIDGSIITNRLRCWAPPLSSDSSLKERFSMKAFDRLRSSIFVDNLDLVFFSTTLLISCSRQRIPLRDLFAQLLASNCKVSAFAVHGVGFFRIFVASFVAFSGDSGGD